MKLHGATPPAWAEPIKFDESALRLAALIDELTPQLIHSMEFQHAGYLTLAAREILGANGAFPPWAVTSWGSDINFFRQFPPHARLIRQVLEGADFFISECERDVHLARDFGFTGTVAATMPVSGGFNLNQALPARERHLPSERKLVLVKGYESFAGRALTALAAIERLAPELAQFSIRVYSASDATIAAVRRLRRRTGLDIAVVGRQSHEAMLAMFAEARIYIGISASDGISVSLLESMVMGAFPIQTNTACWSEWFVDGVGGFSVPVDDVEVIAERIKRALLDDDLVNSASERNWAVARARLDTADIDAKEVAAYVQMLGL